MWLDENNNGRSDVGDIASSAFGINGGTIVSGDWNGDGRTKTGVYKNGFWFLDYNGNGIWDGPLVDRLVALGGQSGEIPITGDWNGDGRTKAGVYQNGVWALDYNGNGQWDGAAIDRFIAFGGAATEVPLIGKW